MTFFDIPFLKLLSVITAFVFATAFIPFIGAVFLVLLPIDFIF